MLPQMFFPPDFPIVATFDHARRRAWQMVLVPMVRALNVTSLFLPLLPSSGDFPTVSPTRVGLRPGSGIPTLADRTPSEVRLRVGEFQAMPAGTLDGWICTDAGLRPTLVWLWGMAGCVAGFEPLMPNPRDTVRYPPSLPPLRLAWL